MSIPKLQDYARITFDSQCIMKNRMEYRVLGDNKDIIFKVVSRCRFVKIGNKFYIKVFNRNFKEDYEKFINCVFESFKILENTLFDYDHTILFEVKGNVFFDINNSNINNDSLLDKFFICGIIVKLERLFISTVKESNFGHLKFVAKRVLVTEVFPNCWEARLP